MTTPALRRCSALCCEEQIRSTLLMCPEHWRQVPPSLQAEVYRTLRAYNAGRSGKPYLLSVYRAQLEVVLAEGLPYASSIKVKIAAMEAGGVQ